MALLRWQQNIVDEEGNVLPSAEVEIRDEVSGAPVNLFEDIDGNTVKGNPLTVDSDGYGFAYMEPGRFKITATSADQSFTKSWRDVRLANDFSDLDSRINQRVIYVGSVAESLSGLNGKDEGIYQAASYKSGDTSAPISLIFDASVNKSAHNGSTVISPTVPGLSNQSGVNEDERLNSFIRGEGEADPTGSGCFLVRGSDDGAVDLFIIYGQSNAVGRADGSAGRIDRPPYALYWSTDSQSITRLIHDYENTNTSSNDSTGNAWVAFATEYYQRTGRVCLFLPGAYGGLSIADLQKGTGAYDAMLAEYNTLSAELTAKGWNVGHTYCVFSHGEGDQADGTGRESYFLSLRALFDDMITDMSVEHFFLSLVGNPQNRPEESWDVIRSAQIYAGDGYADVSVAFHEAKNFFKYNNLLLADGVHYTQQGYNIMGREMAKTVASFLKGFETATNGKSVQRYNSPEVASGVQTSMVSAAIHITASGAEIMTRGGTTPTYANAPNFQGSFLRNLTLDTEKLVVQATRRCNTANFAMCTAEDRNVPSESIRATVRPLQLNNAQEFAIRLVKNLSIVVDTDSGSPGNPASMYANGFSDPVRIFGSNTITATVGSDDVVVRARPSLNESPTESPIVNRVSTTRPAATIADDVQVVVDANKNAVYLPRNIGLVAITWPNVLINPQDLVAGDEIVVNMCGVVSWND